MSKTAIVTGASAGIGAAAVGHLARAGFRVVAAARRLDRVAEVIAESGAGGSAGSGAEAHALDVTNEASVRELAERVPEVHLLVNNAGLALGLDAVAEARDEDWSRMYETNVLGVMRMSRAFLPALVASGDGHVINVGSIAGFETYPGGGGYTASKHALRAVTKTLRLELLGKPVRVTEICPGLTETEFSLVRFDGDRSRAAGVYRGLQPLVADDVAECIAWAATRPSHVNVDEIVVRPRAQATSMQVAREERA